MKAFEEWSKNQFYIMVDEKESAKQAWEAALEFILSQSECLGETGIDGIPLGCKTIKIIERELND